MVLDRRYQPAWPPGEQGYVGMDFSPLIEPGVALTQATLTIVRNTNPVTPQTDFQQQPVQVMNRQSWCFLTGGAEGTDYQLRWTATDSNSNTWNRSALMLCAESS